MLKVCLSGPLKAAADGAASVSISAATIRELLRELIKQYPGMQNQLDDGIAVAVPVGHHHWEPRRHGLEQRQSEGFLNIVGERGENIGGIPDRFADMGVAAIQGFDLSLTDTDGGAGGDYLRSFGAEIRPSADGTPPENIGGEILTSAPIELGEMTMGLKIEALWITLDPDLNTITGDTIEGVHPVGRHTVPTE
jgi:hypothetical protein